jgi:sec-independent protein translocase protein TatC
MANTNTTKNQDKTLVVGSFGQSLSGSNQSEFDFVNNNTKTIISHLGDIGKLGLKMIMVTGVAMIGAGFYYKQILDFLIAPVGAQTLQFLNPADSLMFVIKTVCYSGLLIALPVLVFLVYQYLADIFNKKVLKHFKFYTMFITLLAYTALAYGYLFLFPISIQFLVGFNPGGIKTVLSAMAYLDFTIFIYFGLMVIFQTPVIVLTLINSGLFSKKIVASKRRYIYLIILILSAVLTPTPDIFTMLIMALPIVILFELSLLCAQG